MSILIIRRMSVWFKMERTYLFTVCMITLCFQYLFLAKWKKRLRLSKVVILLAHDGYAIYNTANFLSNCILHFLQCQLYWMIKLDSLWDFIFVIKIVSLPKGNNQNSISINGTCTGPNCMLFVSSSGVSCVLLSRLYVKSCMWNPLNIKRDFSCQDYLWKSM